MGENSVDVKIYFPYQSEAASLMEIFCNLIFFKTTNSYKLFIPENSNSYNEYGCVTLLKTAISNSTETSYRVELSDDNSNIRLDFGDCNCITLHVDNPPYFATMINKVFNQVSECGGVVIVYNKVICPVCSGNGDLCKFKVKGRDKLLYFCTECEASWEEGQNISRKKYKTFEDLLEEKGIDMGSDKIIRENCKEEQKEVLICRIKIIKEDFLREDEVIKKYSKPD